MQVNMHEAKTHFSKLIGKVQEGEEIVIAKAGKPVAKIIPIPARSQRFLGSAKGQITMADDFDAPLPDELLQAFYR